MLAMLELLGRRWALRLVWELRRDALTFSALRRRSGASTSVLSQRLRDLGAAGVVEHDLSGRYLLTPAGRDLARVLYELNRWSATHAHAGAILGA
jgi:DNA-binding HxlR family transcriptional regulator